MRIPPAFPAQHTSPFSRCRTQGRELRNTGPHTRAESSPCVRCVFLKSGSLCAYSEGVVRDPEQSSWGLGLVRVLPLVWTRVVGRVRSMPCPGAGVSPGSGRGRSRPCRSCPQRAPLWCGCSPGRGRALSARVRVRGRVVDTDARCRHREGVVDIVRGLSTPRGGYNARWCQQRASVPISHADCQQRASVRTTRVGDNNARRRPRPGPSSVRTTRAHADNARRCDCGLGEYALGGAPKGAPQKNLGKENQDCACSFGVAVMMVSPKATGPASAGVIAANFFLLVTTTGVIVS